MAKKKNEDDGIDKFRLARTIIAIPLLQEIRDKKEEKKTKGKGFDNRIRVIIDLNLRFTGGDAEAGKKRAEASKKVRELLAAIKKDFPEYKTSTINENSSQFSQQYIFATLHPEVIEELARRDETQAKNVSSKRSIYHLWPDFKVKAFTTKSVSTVKADAAHASFSAFGKGITWAVIDSGIDRKHKHFDLHKNIHEDDTFHHDFTENNNPFLDGFGHGTHVAGIIAGEFSSKKDISSITAVRDEFGDIHYKKDTFNRITGMAPCCKLVSLKVLDDEGNGQASSLIAAIAAIQDINGYGRDIKIHGVNLSLGYEFEPEWFACGQSPLCVEVDRLVRTGVVVVAAAGNTGYGTAETEYRGNVSTGLPFSINDPGNAELAITVGSTHRDMPHTYGVSYFSSKGPTGDGRIKPDLVAPGEKIVSCATGNKKHNVQKVSGFKADYTEDSGTSMAAPHVSGVIAAFLSVRREFIGKPELVKHIFASNATDLKRDRYFQGSGLVDLMRAIQSV
jgi:subtilisin family serine protease